MVRPKSFVANSLNFKMYILWTKFPKSKVMSLKTLKIQIGVDSILVENFWVNVEILF